MGYARGMAEDTEVLSSISFTWRDREMKMRVPNGAQLMMWNRVATQFGEFAEVEKVDMQVFRKVLNRLGDVVFALFVDEADVEWLEDEILKQRVEDKDLLDLFTTMRDAINETADEQGNREQRRARARKSTAQRVK